ncbi:MAG: ribosome biogenesis GTPase Der [Deltaproteobacteria bacterium]
MPPIIAIVGRPNVGKSTLLNRIVGRRAAIVEDTPGVTRDRNYVDTEWLGHRLTLVDTGGFWVDVDEQLLKDVRAQAEQAIQEAALLFLVVDGRAGLTSADLDLAAFVRKTGKPVIVAVNKIDGGRVAEEVGEAEFHRLGFSELAFVSAEHGRGIAELLDRAIERLPDVREVEPEPVEEVPRVAILGRPNVGKSTLANRLLGEARFIESPVAGTTRDPLDAEVTARGRRYVLTDTAGIRRKAHVGEDYEVESVDRALAVLDRSDVALVLLDAMEPAVEQDARLIGEVAERAKPLLLVVNKADLLSGTKGRKAVEEKLEEELPFLPKGTPIAWISARTGAAIATLLPNAGRLFDQAARRLSTPEVNRFLRDAEDAHPPPRAGGLPVRLYYMTQVGVRPPSFVLHVNRPEGITEAYRRFLSNRLRERFEIEVPVRLIFKKRARRGS